MENEPGAGADQRLGAASDLRSILVFAGGESGQKAARAGSRGENQIPKVGGLERRPKRRLKGKSLAGYTVDKAKHVCRRTTGTIRTDAPFFDRTK